jgi:hypothetical protein
MWPLPGGALPPSGGEWLPERWESLPARVIGHALREAAARKLEGAGFERLPGAFESPVRFFRRKVNLAAGAAALLAGGPTGVFPLLLVQQFVLEPGAGSPAQIGLIVDMRTIRRLDRGLVELRSAGLSIDGMRIRWDHTDDCTCKPRQVGHAGLLISGDPSGEVRIRRGQTASKAWGPCLAPMATRSVLTEYVARLSSSSPDKVQTIVDRAAIEQRSLPKLVEALAATQRLLSPLSILGGATAEFQDGLDVSTSTGGWPELLPPAPEPKLNFHYGDPQLSRGAGAGLARFGPFDQSTNRLASLKVAISAPKDLADDAMRLRRALVGPIVGFVGMAERLRLESLEIDVRLFNGSDRAAYHEAAAALAAGDRPDLAFLVIRARDREAPVGDNPYLAAKAVFVGRELPSQAITVEKLRQSDAALQWTMDSLVVAAYAKVNNIPFVLHDPGGGRELTVGIGRTDVEDPATGERTQLYGSAVVFRQDGDFLLGGTTKPVLDRGDYEAGLAELLTKALETYEAEQGVPVDRLTIHVFKRTGRREANAVQTALAGRSSQVEVALVHVNRDSPLQLFALDGTKISFAEAGTVVALGSRDRLLVTGDAGKPGVGHPLRLTLDRTSTSDDMDRVVEHAYGLTAMSWRGLRRGNEPVTIAYGRLLALKTAELRPYGLQEAGLTSTPWFL